MDDVEIGDWEKILLLEQALDKALAEVKRLAPMVKPHLRCLACGAARVLPADEPIEVSMKWLDGHERGQIIHPGSGAPR